MKRTLTYKHTTSPRQIARDLRSMAAGTFLGVRCGDFQLRRVGFSVTAARIIARHLERLARLEAGKK